MVSDCTQAYDACALHLSGLGLHLPVDHVCPKQRCGAEVRFVLIAVSLIMHTHSLQLHTYDYQHQLAQRKSNCRLWTNGGRGCWGVTEWMVIDLSVRGD